jgi:hypothetical protein
MAWSQKKTSNGEHDLLASVWVDPHCIHLIHGSRAPMQRQRYRQMNHEDPNTDAELIHLESAQPTACEVCYNACGMIDRHNRYRRDNLDLENKIQMQDWANRFSMLPFGIYVVAALLLMLAYKQVTKTTEDQREFYIKLSKELTDYHIQYKRQRKG